LQVINIIIWLFLQTIPKKFADNVRGQISQEIKLEVPDGQTYSVQVDKEQHKLALGSGWNLFASDCELEEGDMLLFGYSGNSHFKVRIFNVNGCDKFFSCVMKNINPCGLSRTGRSVTTLVTLCVSRGLDFNILTISSQLIWQDWTK
jgi:hypothetical protein